MKRLASVCLFWIVVFSGQIFAQGSTQIIVTGIPPILQSPYLSDLENNFNQGHYQIQFIYNNSDPAPMEFIFEITASKDGEQLANVISDPVAYTPGTYIYRTFEEHPRVNFPQNPLDQIPSHLMQKVIREGILPEGGYTIEIEARPYDPFAMVSPFPAMVYFEVRYPQPPMLISPFNEGIAPPVYTAFTWTPVFAIPGYQFEYDLLVVELFEGQNPEQAISANPVFMEETTNQPIFIHTQQYIPFEFGREYAWQVRAREANQSIPISDDGKSEIFTFKVGDPFGIDFEDLDSIVLIPNFARIIQLDQLDVSQQAQSITLDGFATLQVDLPETGTVNIIIELIELQVQVTGFASAVAIGGQVSGDVQVELFPIEGIGDIVTLDNIRWSVFEGLTLDARIIDPGGQYLEAEGSLALTPSGIFGAVWATGPQGQPLLSFDMHPLELAVYRLAAVFPGAHFTMDAQLNYFGEPTPCQITNIYLSQSPVSISFSCDIEKDIPLLPNADLATLFMAHASGEVEINWETGSIDFSTTATASLRLKALEGKHYDINAIVNLSSTEGVSIQIWSPGAIFNPPKIDLGIASLMITNIRDPFLSYDMQTRQWDFGIDFDAQLEYPDFDNLRITGLGGITLDRYGLHFPSFHFGEEQLQWVPIIELAGFGARLTSFTLPEFTFPWFDWDGNTLDPWDFSFGFHLSTPNFGNHLPSCLRNLSLHIDNATFSGGSFAAELPATSFSEGQCAIEWGTGYGIQVHKLSGGIFGQLDGSGFALDGYASLDASLMLGSPFACDGESAMTISAEQLRIRGDGILEGNIANIIPQCPLKVGPYTAGFNETLLAFSRENNSQKAVFEAGAFLDFPAQGGGTNRINGQIGVNLITGEFYDLEFHITEPFVWVIPEEEEVLRFNIDEASITLDGLFINGTQRFLVADNTISVVFNRLLLDLQTFTVKSGSIEFAEGFAFEAGIQTTDFSLTYSTRPLNSSLSEELDPGIYFELAGEISIDSLGLRASGSADAELRFGGVSMDKLSVNFSDDFAFGLDPFKVESGQIEILWDGRTVAIIDHAGFHPVFSFFDLAAVIPERLPMPAQEIAYLVVKENDELLIEVEQDPENALGLIIGTKPGKSIDYVFPILQGDHATPPVLNVEFSNVKISISPFTIESGEILVSVPDFDERFDLTQYGIPFSIKDIAYGAFEEGDILHKGLFFGAELKLFEKDMGEGSFVTLFVDGNGALIGSFDLKDLDTSIPLVGESDMAVLSIDAVAGFGEFHLLQPQLPNFEFNIGGGFEIKADENNRARADIVLEYTRQEGISLKEFEYDITYKRPKIDIDPFIFQINEIQSLDMSWNRTDGFDFYAALDIAFGMRLEEDTLLIPVQGVEIRPTGFAIPAQEINDGSEPPLQVPPLEMFGIHLQALAFRIQQVEVNVFDFTPGDLAGLIPRMDFALAFPGLEELAPQMQGLSLTVLDAGFQNGRLTGEVEVHQPLIPIEIPLGDMLLKVERFAGALSEILEDGIPKQGISIEIEGEIPELFSFQSEQECDPATFALAIVQGSGFSGNIQNFVPCGEIPIGSLALAFTSSGLEFDFMDGEQSAILAGAAELNIPRAEGQAIKVEGNIAFDLMTGNIIDGAIMINEPFDWNVPPQAEDPFFTFVVEQARLDTLGLTLRANGQMKVTETLTVEVNFDDLAFSIKDLEIVSGQAFISSEFAFEMRFLPIEWKMVAPIAPLPVDTNLIRMNFEDLTITLNKDGFGLSGESTAQIKLVGFTQPGAEDNGEEDEEDEDEQFFENLTLKFSEGFMLHTPPRAYAKNGRAEIWLEEDDESTLLAWYDEDGLGIGDFLGLLPIPDILDLPTREIAYMVLRDDDGQLLVELETEGGTRTLRTREGKSVDIVIAAITDEDGNNPKFSTEFSISVDDAFQITDGSIQVSLENNPFKVPEMPLKITGLSYEKREDGVAALTASALLDLPESLDELQIVIDEIRFSQHGFEQVTVSIGNPDFEQEDTPAISQSFAESALILNVHYAMVAFGETNAFSFDGTFQSSFFKDEETEELAFLPFSAGYEQHGNPTGQWSFALDMDYTEPVSVSYAQFNITQLEAMASAEEFAILLSGVISLPEILGDDFSVTIESLSLGTRGISVGDISVDLQEQQFSFFNERVIVTVSSLQPSYDQTEQALFISMDGSMKVLNRDIVFEGLTIGTNGHFGIGAGLGVNLLETPLVILENHLEVNQVSLGVNEHKMLWFEVGGEVTLPDPFHQTSGFSVHISKTPEKPVDIAVSGPHFQFSEGYGIGGDRVQITLGDIATLELTGAAVNIDFKDINNTTFLATAVVYVENDVNKRIEFGKSENIQNEWGFRYNYPDKLQWQITSAPDAGNALFTFDAGFFAISIHAVATVENSSDFSIAISGRAGIKVPGLSGEADFRGFVIDKTGIAQIGNFHNNVTFTLLDKVTLSLEKFDYKTDKQLDLIVEAEGSTMEKPEQEVITIETTHYLRIVGAELSFLGISQDNGEGGSDSFKGGVDSVLFYRTTDGGMHLYISNANLKIRDAAEVQLNMRLIREGEDFLLSVAGNGTFSAGGTGVSMSVAGKFETKDSEISFGLFVAVSAGVGIPIIPGVITLNGLGGGFYYRPVNDDFGMVRDASKIDFLKTPTAEEGMRFAAFLYAKVGIVEPTLEGTFYMEITDQFTSLYVNGLIMEQPKERLFANMVVTVYYDTRQMIQGEIKVNIDYYSVVEGEGVIGFFAKKESSESTNVIWAIYGKKSLRVIGLIGTESRFIACNEGFHIGMKTGIYFKKYGITIDVLLETEMWYLVDNGFGAYGFARGELSGYGVTLGADIYAAYISKHRLFYASGGVYVDLFVFSGRLEGWASYKDGKWDGGRGSNAEYMALIQSARQEALRMYDSTREAMDKVESAVAELNAAADFQELIENIMDQVDDMSKINTYKAAMDNTIAYVVTITPPIVDRLGQTMEVAIVLQDELEQLATDLENPISINLGTISVEGDTMTVSQQPSINFNATADQNNQDATEGQIESIEEQIEYYREVIGKAMGHLAELEMIIDGVPAFSFTFVTAANLVFDPDFIIPINTTTLSLDQPGILPPHGGGIIHPGLPAFGFGTSMAMQQHGGIAGGIVNMDLQDVTNFLNQYSQEGSFNYLAEKFTDAVESIKRFYSIYQNELWALHKKYTNEGSTQKVNATLAAIAFVNSKYETEIIPLETKHQIFTESLNLLYSIKGQMATTIYGMLQAYARILETAMEEEELAEIEQIQIEIAQKLEPPVISSFVINPSFDPDARNISSISWTASHVDELVETSYSIRPFGIGAFSSAGAKKFIHHNTFKRTLAQQQRNYTIAIRARGSGGNTTIQSTSVILAVDEQGSSSEGGQQLPDNVPRPHRPFVTLPYLHDMAGNTFLKAYTNNSHSINLVIQAHAPQSDIVRFQYALGSSTGATDIVDWTDAVGVIEPVIVNIYGVSRKITTSISGLSLEHNQSYYISVKAFNTEGLSNQRSLNYPVVYDASAPSQPVITSQLPQYAYVWAAAEVFPVSITIPTWNTPQLKMPDNNTPPTLFGEWTPAIDDESGIWHYEYIVSSKSDAQEAFEQTIDIQTTEEPNVTISGEPLSYTDYNYFHLRAVNKARITGEPVSSPRFKVPDPSRPSRPVARLRFNNSPQSANPAFIYLTQLSLDFESQTVGYQYSIGTSPGFDNIRGWSEEFIYKQTFTAALKYNFILETSGNVPNVTPTFGLPLGGLPQQTNLFVNVRAVNSQGIISTYSSSGPFQLGTSPSTPSISMEYDESSSRLYLTIGNIQDPGLPILSVRYKITNLDGSVIRNWLTIPGSAGHFPQPGSVTASPVVSLPAAYRVEVMVTNVAGASTTNILTHNPNVIFNPPPAIIFNW